MPEFSPELYIKKEDGAFDPSGYDHLKRLKDRIDQGGMFNEDIQVELENWKTKYPGEWAILQNDEAFQNLSPQQQEQVAIDGIRLRRKSQ